VFPQASCNPCLKLKWHREDAWCFGICFLSNNVMHWDHRFKDIVFCIGLTFGILGSLKCFPEEFWDPQIKVTLTTGVAYMAFRWPENGISEGCWDHRLKVLWLLVNDFLALWQPEIDIPVGLENHRRHCTWLLEKHFLAFWLLENAERRPAVIGYVRKNVKEWILAARNFGSSRWWIRYLAIIEPLFGIFDL